MIYTTLEMPGRLFRHSISMSTPAKIAMGTGLVFLVLTALLSVFIRNGVSHHSESQFASDSKITADAIADTVEDNLVDLSAVAAYVQHGGDEALQSFDPFVRQLKADGLCALSLSFLAYADLQSGTGPGEKYIVQAMMPPPQAERFLGTDANLWPGLTEAIRLASASGRVVATPLVSLEGDDAESIVLFVQPVYGADPAGTPDGEQRVVGVAVAAHNARTMVELSLDGFMPPDGGTEPLHISIFDTDPAHPEEIYSGGIGDHMETLSRVEVFEREIIGRPWRFEIFGSSHYGLETTERALVPVAAGIGVLGSLLMAGGMFALASRSERLVAKATRLESRNDHVLMELAELGTRISMVLDSASEGILLCDSNRNVVWINDALSSMFGVDPKSVRPGQSGMSLREGAAASIVDPVGFYHRVDEIYDDEYLIEVSEDVEILGEPNRTLSRSTAPVRDDDEHYIGRLWIYRDVTAERQAEKAKSEFVAMVSHELRSPLTNIRGNLELMNDGLAGKLSQRQASMVESGTRSTLRLQHLIDDLLDQSLIEGGTLDLDFEPVSIRLALDAAVVAAEGDIAEKGLSLTLDVPENLPLIKADLSRLTQVVTNLVSNAARYTPEGGKILIQAYEDAGRVYTTIKDTGPGIPVEDQARIFDPFYRVATDAPRPQGSTGLGLAIARSLTEVQRGEISVDSRPGDGTTFTVNFEVWSG